jgi:hypothetical protein
MKILSWILRIVAAIILLQTLYYKFSAHPDSVYIFSEIGLEPYGRIGSGVAELIIGIILLFMSKHIWLGALGAMGVMTGAIFFHLTSLGIDVHNDGGTLFYMAVVVWLAGLVLLVLHKNQIPLAMFQKK